MKNRKKYKMEKRKKQWQMMKNREATMKHDEKVRKNKIRWKKEKIKQWQMMKNRETTMKHDEKWREKTIKNYEK